MGYICITLLFLALVAPGHITPGLSIGLLCSIAWFVLMILAKAGVWVAP